MLPRCETIECVGVVDRERSKGNRCLPVVRTSEGARSGHGKVTTALEHIGHFSMAKHFEVATIGHIYFVYPMAVSGLCGP